MTTPSTTALTWHGVDRRGRGRAGRVTAETPSELTERLYRRGYVSAQVVRDGLIVGAVAAAPSGRERTWWGESS